MRINESRVGKIPITLVRHLTSLCKRSIGFVEWSLPRGSRGSAFEGVHKSLALQHGPGTPLLTRVTVVFDGERLDGEMTRGLVSLSRGDGSLSNDQTIAMLVGGMSLISLQGIVLQGIVTKDREGDDDPA